VALYFYDLAPDLPACTTVEQLREFYWSGVSGVGAELVECALESVAGQVAIRVLMKAPQQPSGRFYQAAYTLPFRDFSFVIKVQCREHGMTGVRETILADRRMAAGEMPDVTGKGPFFRDWNPDSPEYDAEFPEHPVSRARRILEHVARTAVLDQAVSQLPKFGLPGGAT
jgi:hypothetical protein